MKPSFLQRIFPRTYSAGPISGPVQDVEPKRLMDTKASSLTLLPKGAYGSNLTFFSPDGGRTTIPIDGSGDNATIFAFVAYWYVATRWRAQKIAEAPLMVVKEDQDDGADEWLPDHELVSVLDTPSEDYDMGELIEMTSHYLDNSGAALWVFDTDGVGTPARITPFSRWEFEPKSDGTRLFASFRVNTRSGPKDFPAEQCAFFRDFVSQSWGWERGRSRLDVALAWLRLGRKAAQTIHDLLDNSMWPSAVIIPDKEWNPDPKTLAEYKQDIEAYAHQGQKGRPFIQLGGGQFVPLQSAIKDLVPDEVLNRVESVVASVSGVPAIVLQFQVGMENSPWSQMAQARRMAYDDTISPTWRKFERILTRQMLRPMDDDETHFIRFDTSKVESLQADQQQAVQIAVMMGRAASLNERRKQMGLEPIADPKADQIPELTAPDLATLLAGMGGGNDTTDSGDGKDPAEDDPKEEDTPPKDKKQPNEDKSHRALLERKFKTIALQSALRTEAITAWTAVLHVLLKHDADHIAQLVLDHLHDPVDTKGRPMSVKARGKDRAMNAISGYLRNESASRWSKTMTPLIVQGAERSTAVVSADMNVSFNLMHRNTLAFARKQTGDMISQVSKTTKSLISDIIQGGLDANASRQVIAKTIQEATGLSLTRATLIARTETTKAYNGAPQEALAQLGRDTGRAFSKTWSGVLDDIERDEHVDMEGETVLVDEPFSNGLMYPSEPNCRCTALYNEVDDE